MCEKCEQQEQIEQTRQRLSEKALRNPMPCVVCGEKEVVGVGTWLPDQKHYLAAGGTNERVPIFSFWMCRVHCEPTKANEKLVMQAVLRTIREKKARE